MKIFSDVNKLNNTVKATMIYVLASLISKGLSFITLPIFTRIMPADQIGIVNIYNSWFAILSKITSLALISGGFNLAMKEFSDHRNQYCSSILYLITLVSLLMFVNFIVFQNFYIKLTALPGKLLYLLFAGILFQPAYDIWMARSRYEYRYKTVGILTIFTAITASAFSAIIVLWADKHNLKNLGEYRLFANNLFMYGMALIIYIMILAKGRTLYQKEYWAFSLSLSLPLIVHQMASEILNVSDRVMIGKYIGNSEVGIYSTIYSFGSISMIIWSAINMAYIPYLFKNIEDEKERSSIQETSSFIIAVYGCIVSLISLFAPDIIRILTTKDYLEACDLVPPIAAGIFFIAVSNLYSNVLIYYKKTNYIMIATVIGAFLNLFLNYVGIRMLGYKIAAYTTFLSYAIMLLFQKQIALNVMENVSHSKSHLYNEKRLLLIEILVVLICGVSLILYQYFVIRYIFAITIVLIVFYKRDYLIQNTNIYLLKKKE